MSGSMKADSPLIAWLTLALLLSVSVGLSGQEFVYTNNDLNGPNSVSAFSIGSGGTLTPVAGTPFETGGNGSGGGSFFASNRVSAAISGTFLYASNCGSNNVTGFSINAATGVLTPVPGSPFATGGSCGLGIAVAVTPDTRFLYAANAGSSNISAFSIAASGALSPIAGSPFAAGGIPDGIKVSPDGKYMAVAIENPVAQVAMFSIGLTGALTAVPGSPFLVGGAGGAAGVDINCASNLLFVGEAGPADTVSVQGIASNGALSPVAGSPFTFGGVNSNVIVLSPDDLHAFVSNQGSNTITALDVASGGSLTQVAGSPFANPNGLLPSGMATNQTGTFLYAANVNRTVTGFSIAGNGALAPVPGSPFANGIPGASNLLSLAVFPPKSCVVSTPCPLTHGFWKTHPDTWPVTTLTLGGITYTQAQLLEILNTPVGAGKRADASLKLADQLIAALLDIAKGSDPLPIVATIADAQSLLSGCALPCGIEVPSALGQQMVADAAVLAQYNGGLLTPACIP